MAHPAVGANRTSPAHRAKQGRSSTNAATQGEAAAPMGASEVGDDTLANHAWLRNNGLAVSIGKNAPTAPCALCVVPSALINSHVVPRWAYKRIAEDRPDRPVPVAVENDVVMFQSNQLADFLLCEVCEDKTRRWDDYAAKVSYDKGRFPILEHALANVIPDPGNTTRVTIADVSDLDVNSLVLFGTSVLWRAAACPQLCPTIQFGPYLETFRAFVWAGGQAAFPSNARLLLTLMNTPDVSQAQQVITKPSAGRMRSSRLYRFMVFGMCFELLVGGLDADLQAWDGGCLARTKRVVLTDGYRHVPDLYTQARRATPKGKFAKHIGRS